MSVLCTPSASQVRASSGESDMNSQCRHFGRILFAFVFTLLSSVVSLASDSQADAPTFQTSTELVLVPVVVKDRHGNHVDGLTRNDFRIFEDGHEIEIRSFDRTTAAATSTMTAAPTKVNMSLSPEIGPAPIILFFDQLNTPASEQVDVRRQLALWYQGQQSLATSTCVVLYTGSALRILQQPTTDAAKVRSAIESIATTINPYGAGASGELPLPPGANENLPVGTGDGPIRMLEFVDYFRHRKLGAGDTGSALLYAGQLFAAWPGEKALIWISAGTTLNIWTRPLEAVQVRLYPLSVHPGIPYEFITSMTDTIGGVDVKTGSVLRGQDQETHEYLTDVNRHLLENLRDAAQETGGDVCNNSLSPQSCVQRVLADATDRYVLSYETHSRSRQPEWRQIKVKVDRPGITVLARKGVMINPTLAGVDKKRQQITAALASPVDFPGLQLELKPFTLPRSGQGLVVSLLMRSDEQHAGVWSTGGVDFTVAGIVLRGSSVLQHFGEDVHGSLPRTTVSALDASGLTWTHKVGALAGPGVVRVVVRDNTTGRIGSITRRLP
jgi:VWFA-related protein